jgi:hypothetical protein
LVTHSVSPRLLVSVCADTSGAAPSISMSLESVNVISAPSDAVIATPRWLPTIVSPRKMAATPRIADPFGIVTVTSTAPTAPAGITTSFAEKTAVAAMLPGRSPAATKARRPSSAITSCASSRKASSRDVWFVSRSV